MNTPPLTVIFSDLLLCFAIILSISTLVEAIYDAIHLPKYRPAAAFALGLKSAMCLLVPLLIFLQLYVRA